MKEHKNQKEANRFSELSSLLLSKLTKNEKPKKWHKIKNFTI